MFDHLSASARHLPVSRTKSRAGRVIGWGLTRVGADPLVTVRTGTGTFVLDVLSRTEASKIWNGTYDEGDLDFLRAVTPPEGTFVDIGANVGLIFVPMTHHLRAAGRAVAVEPVPLNADRLTRSLELNDIVCSTSVHRTALGAARGSIRMVKEGGATTSGNALPTETGEGIPVEMTTLDALVEDIGLERLDTIKIDVEGFEVDVFRSGRRTLERFRPVVIGEFNNTLMPGRGVSFHDAWAIFGSLGYRCYSFVGPRDLVHRPDPPADLGNVALVPEGQLERCLAEGVRVVGEE